MKEKIDRRSFLQTMSLSSMAAMPGINGLSKLLGANSVTQTREFVHHAFRLSRFENLMNLEFYFISGNDKTFTAIEVDKKKDSLLINYGQEEAYMVVRLPQQHIAETYFKEEDLATKSKTAQAIISGYSYLTFRFVFNELCEGQPQYLYKFPLTEENLLSWNNPKLRLVVKQNLSDSIFKITDGSTYPLGYKNKNYHREFFPSAYRTETDPSPITAIEAPSRLIISPKLPNQDIYDFDWDMPSPLIETSAIRNTIENPLWTATLKLKKREEVCVKKVETDEQKLNKDEDTYHQDEKMKVMMIGSAYDDKEKIKKTLDILPAPQNLADLVKLYIIWKLTARADKMTFSPLGITTKIDFKNTKLNETVNAKITLVNWKQYISMGRDEQVEVAHLVLDAETGLKFLLVQTTKRRTYKGNSLLVYRQYLEPLEFEKDYTKFVINKTTRNEENFHKGYSQNTYKYNIPFKKIEILEKERKQILSNESDESFWALSAKDLTPLKFKFKFIHWDDTETIVDKKIFVLRDTLAPPPSDKAKALAINVFEIKKEFEYWKTYKTDATLNLNSYSDYKGKFVISLSKIQISIDAHTVWTNIEHKFGNIAREKANFFKETLGLYIRNYNNRVKAAEDKIFFVLGEGYNDFINKKNQLKQRLIAIHHAYFNDIIAKLNEIDVAIKSFNLNIETERKNIRDIIKDVDDLFKNRNAELKNNLASIKVKINACIAPPNKVPPSVDKVFKEVLLAIDRFQEITDRAYTEVYAAIETNLTNIEEFVKDGLNDINEIIIDLKEAESEVRNKIELGRQKVNFVINEIERKGTEEAKEVLNKALSVFETEYIILSANFKKVEKRLKHFETGVLDFFDEYASFPQLHEAKVYVKAIKDLVNEEIPVSIRLAEDYVKSQANDLFLDVTENASKVFAKVAEDSQEMVKGVMQKLGQEFGGIINPEIAIEYMTFLQRKEEQVAKNVQAQIDKLRKEAETLIGEEKAILKKEIDKLENEAIKARDAILVNIKAREDELKSKKDEIEEQIRNSLPIEEIEKAKKDLNRLRGELEEEIRGIQQDLAFITEDAKNKFNEIKEWGEQQVISAQEYFKDLEAKILGQINLKDILGIDFELPRLNKREGKIEYQFITDKLQPLTLGPFSFKNYLNTDTSRTSQLLVHFGKTLKNGDYNSWTRLSNFNIGILDSRLVLNFENLEIKSSSSEKRKVNVKLGEIEFNKELAFLKNISDAISKLIGIPGLSITVAPTQISVGYNFAMPSISGGVFSLANLKFFVGVNLPIPVGNGDKPITTTIGVNSPNDKFVVAVGIFGGRGFFNLTTTPKQIQIIDMAIEFGGYLGIDLVIAKGEVFLMAGFRYTYNFREKRMSFEGYLICGGSVTVFGFITVSVTFYLGLRYQQFEGRSTLYGTASLTYSVKIAFFKKSFTLTYSKRFHGSDSQESQPTAYLVQEPEYYYAFADESPDENGEMLSYYALYEPEEEHIPVLEEIKSNHKKRKARRKARREEKKVVANNISKVFEDPKDWAQYIRSFNYF